MGVFLCQYLCCLVSGMWCMLMTSHAMCLWRSQMPIDTTTWRIHCPSSTQITTATPLCTSVMRRQVRSSWWHYMSATVSLITSNSTDCSKGFQANNKENIKALQKVTFTCHKERGGGGGGGAGGMVKGVGDRWNDVANSWEKNINLKSSKISFDSDPLSNLCEILLRASEWYHHAMKNFIMIRQYPTNCRMHLFHIPQCSIQNRNVHISVLNGALWDMEQVHSGICGIRSIGGSGWGGHRSAHAGFKLDQCLYAVDVLCGQVYCASTSCSLWVTSCWLAYLHHDCKTRWPNVGPCTSSFSCSPLPQHCKQRAHFSWCCICAGRSIMPRRKTAVTPAYQKCSHHSLMLKSLK